MLISDSYRAQIAENHRINPLWGPGQMHWLEKVTSILRARGYKSAVDYGCGKGMIGKALRNAGFDIRFYDPGIAEYAPPPEPADFLYSLDVLEHIEPALLENVLEHMASLAPEAFLVISMKPAREILPDGRNAHLIIEGRKWWLERLGKFYATIDSTGRKPHELVVECRRL